MKTLINAVEEWIDLRIFSSSKNAIYEATFNEMEKIHIRDANRIAELERRVMILDGDNTFDAERATTIESRLDDLEMGMEERTNSPSPESDAEEPMYEADQMLSELIIKSRAVDSRLDDLECSMEHKTDSDEVETMVESGIEDLDFPDSYAIEVMIDDAIETKVMDAVIAEINATDFKITVER